MIHIIRHMCRCLFLGLALMGWRGCASAIGVMKHQFLSLFSEEPNTTFHWKTRNMYINTKDGFVSNMFHFSETSHLDRSYQRLVMASSGLYCQLKSVHSFWGLLFFTFILGTIALRLSNHSYLAGLNKTWRHMTDGIFKRVFLSLNIHIIHHQNELFVVGRHQIGNNHYICIYMINQCLQRSLTHSIMHLLRALCEHVNHHWCSITICRDSETKSTGGIIVWNCLIWLLDSSV